MLLGIFMLWVAFKLSAPWYIMIIAYTQLFLGILKLGMAIEREINF